MSDVRHSGSPEHEPDREVLAALGELPRDGASPGFTDAVLARTNAPAAPADDGSWSRPMMLLAASLVLVTVVTAGALERAHQRRELRGQVEALKSEHEQLEREFAEIKRLSAEQPDVVYLGGDDNVDVLWRVAPGTPGTAAVPSSNPAPGGAVPARAERN